MNAFSPNKARDCFSSVTPRNYRTKPQFALFLPPEPLAGLKRPCLMMIRLWLLREQISCHMDIAPFEGRYAIRGATYPAVFHSWCEGGEAGILAS